MTLKMMNQAAEDTTGSITLQLSTHTLLGDDAVRLYCGEDDTPERVRKIYATVALTRGTVEMLLRLSSLFWTAHKLGGGLCRMVYTSIEPQFYGEVFRNHGERQHGVTDEEDQALKALFKEKNVPTKGFKRAPHGLPKLGTIPCQDTKLVVSDTGSYDRPGMVDYFWLTTTARNGVMLRTDKLPQEDVQALLAWLA